MSRDRNDLNARRERRRSAAVEAAAARPSTKVLSRRAREQLQQRIILGVVGTVGAVVLLVVGFGAYRELIGFPGQPVAIVAGDYVTLRSYTDDLADEMRNLQNQVAAGANQQDPNGVGSDVQRLINAQETLPEDVLEKDIENTLIRSEAKKRGIVIPPADLDKKINETLSSQRALLNAPTNTPTPTFTPRPTFTPTPEGFQPSNTPTPTPSPDPLTPTATLDPLSPTVTRTPFPTRETATPVLSPTPPATLEPTEFTQAYKDLVPLLKSESKYRQTVELQLLRERLRLAIGADLPTSGPRVHVLRLATSTRDEARVALIQIDQGYPFEEIIAQSGERQVEGRVSGDLGWVAKGAEMKEFDDTAFSSDTPLNQWIEPFQAGFHWELVQILERDSGPYDDKNLDKMRDRAFKEWLDAAKASDAVQRDLSPQERQWAVDRASKGIIETSTR